MFTFIQKFFSGCKAETKETTYTVKWSVYGGRGWSEASGVIDITIKGDPNEKLLKEFAKQKNLNINHDRGDLSAFMSPFDENGEINGEVTYSVKATEKVDE